MSGSVLCNDPLVITEQVYSCAVSNSMPKHGFAELPLLSIRSIHSSNPEEKSYQLHQYPDRSVFFSTDDSPSFICQKGLKQTGAVYLIVLQAIDEKRVDLSEPLPIMSSKVDKQDTEKPEENGGFSGLLNIKTFQHLVDSPTPSRPVIGAITASMESQNILSMTRQEATQTPETPSLIGLDLSLDLSLQHLLMLLLLGGPDMAEAFSLSESQLMSASPLELTALVEKLEEYLLPGQLLTDHQNTTEDMHFTRLIQTLMQRLQSIQTLASRLGGGENTSPQLQRIRRDRLAVLQADFAGQIAVVQHSIQAGNDPALLLLDSIQVLHEAEQSSDISLPTENYLHDNIEIPKLNALLQKQDYVLEQTKWHDNARPGDLWNILANRLMVLEVETAQIIMQTIPPALTTPNGNNDQQKGSPPSDHPQEDSDSGQTGDNGNARSPEENSASGEAFGGGEQPPEQRINQEKSPPNGGTRDINAELLSAATNNDLNTARWCLDQGADINATNRRRETALIIAASNNSAVIVEILLSREPAINHTDYIDRTALMMAAKNGHTDIVKSLLEHGAAINNHRAGDNQALTLAAENGHTEVVNSLLRHIVDINRTNNFGETALIQAATGGHTNVVKALLESGADTRIFSDFGRTALIAAAELGRIEVVKTLLEYRLSWLESRIQFEYWLLGDDAIDDNFNENLVKALCEAAKHGHTEIFKSLLEHGTSVEDCVSRNHTAEALINAIMCDHIEAVKLLLERGVDPEYTNQNPDTHIYLYDLPPLFWAVYWGRTEIFKVLLEHNAKTDPLINDESLMSNMVGSLHFTIALILYEKALKSSPVHYCRLLHETVVNSIKSNHSGAYELFMIVFNSEALTRTGQYASFPLHLRAIAESPERYLELMQFGTERDKAEDTAEEGYIFECRQKLDEWRDQAINSMDELFLDQIWMLDFLTLDDGKCIREWLLKYEPKLETARWKGLSLLHLVALQNRPDVLAPLLFILEDLSPMNVRGCTPLHCTRMLGYEAIREILEPAILQSEGKPTPCRKSGCLYCASPSPVFSLQSLASNVVRRSGESLGSMHGRLKGAPGLTQIIFAQAPHEDTSGKED